MHHCRQTLLAFLAFGLLTLLLNSPSAADDEPGVMRPLDQFVQLSLEHGLPHRRVFDIDQDRDGFLWFATQNGLSRYDGHEIRTYVNDPEDPESIPDNYVSGLEFDAQGRLWTLFQDGTLSRLDPVTERFVHFQVAPAQPGQLSAPVRHMLADGALVYAATEAGLEIYSEGAFKPVVWDGAVGVMFLAKTEDALWLGSEEGLRRLDPKTGQVQNAGRGKLATEEIGTMVGDSEGRLWADVGSQVIRFDPRDGSMTEYEVPFPALGLAVTRSGQVWLSTVGGGACRFDRDGVSEACYRQDSLRPKSLADNTLFKVFEDRSGTLWFGSASNGVSQLDPRRLAFRHYRYDPRIPEGLPDREVVAHAEDLDGALWFGTLGGGLVRLDRETGQARRFVPGPDGSGPGALWIWALLVEPDGTLWIGHEAGLDRLLPGADRFEGFRHDPDDASTLSDGRVLTLLRDRSGRLWVGAGSSLDIWQPESQTFVRSAEYAPGLTSAPILSLLEDHAGTIWVGTDQRGVARLDPRTGDVTSYSRAAGTLHHDTISSILELPDGVLWIGALGSGGLARLETATGEYRVFGTQDGLPSSAVTGLLADEAGALWVSSDKALARFDPDSERVRVFNARDGLLRGGYNTKSFLKTSRGELIVGGRDGVVLFDPTEVAVEPDPPRALLTGFELYRTPVRLSRQDPASPLEKPIHKTERLTLDHRQRAFAFEFSADRHANPGKHRFAYRLTGYDQEWIQTDGAQRLASYANLPAGNYIFEVKAAEGRGPWGEPTTLAVQILPPPWRTWWAYGLYLAIVGGLVAQWVQSQRSKLAQQQRVNKELRRLDRMKDEFLANTSHELRTPLHGMTGLAESLLDLDEGLPDIARSHLGMIVASGKRLNYLVDEILDFSKLREKRLNLVLSAVDMHTAGDVAIQLLQPLAASKGLELLNEIDPDIGRVKADEHRLQQILHNLIGNAIKFTLRGKVVLLATSTEDEVRVEVRDTGIGIPEEEIETIFAPFEQVAGVGSTGGTGLGLAITRNLIHLHQGQIWLDSEVGRGTSVFFTLPITEAVELPATDEINLAEVLASPSFDPPVSLLAEPEPQSLSGTKLRNGSSASTILIVDDEPVNRLVLRNHLHSAGYSTRSASSGSEALALLNGDPGIDLVLLDVMMPEMSGYEACQILRRTHPLQDLPVLFLTARSQEEDRLTGLAAGANDFLTKPISKPELLARVKIHLELHNVYHRLEDLVEERTRQLKILRGLLPICSNCKKIRDDQGYWTEVEAYVCDHSEAEFTHGICPGCIEELYGLDVEAWR